MDGNQLTTEIIAEIGQNHNGDMSVAAELIKEAKRAGADVAKFQVYDARALFPPKSAEPLVRLQLRDGAHERRRRSAR